MRSTDMFLSASSRKNAEKPVVLPQQTAPKGESFSPHVLSLWEKPLYASVEQKIIPAPQISQNKNPEISKNSSLSLETEKSAVFSETFSAHALPESEISAPSREDQIAKVKQAMRQFEEVTGKTSQASNKGFFRNLSSLLH